MNKKELKKLWTRVAKGEISEKEAQDLIKHEKVAENKPVKEFKGKNTHKRTKLNKSREVK